MRRRARGIALAVVLVLLLGLSVLAVSGLSGGVASLTQAGFDLEAARAFEAAETSVSRALATGTGSVSPLPPWPDVLPDVVASAVLSEDPPGADGAWPQGFSVGLGERSFVLRHRAVLAEGRAGRGTRVRIEQGYVVIAPTRGAAP